MLNNLLTRENQPVFIVDTVALSVMDVVKTDGAGGMRGLLPERAFLVPNKGKVVFIMDYRRRTTNWVFRPQQQRRC
jgi:hypothetical protein